jgi:hypothetical protein
MEAGLESLVSSLLYEGYALYPYTPGAAKNATPTPFGIVYPPAYAAQSEGTFDQLRLECVLEAEPGCELRAEVCFLQASGERHQASERRLTLPATAVDALLAGGVGAEFAFEASPSLTGRARLRTERLDGSLVRVRACVHNSTELPGDPDVVDRPRALLASLLSTHVIVSASAGRFFSPLEREGAAGRAVAACRNLNTFPVLASADDRTVLGAAIVLPDHPRLAPESLGNLFDNTEIEEALLLHVQALSDAERAAAERQDPAVREMLRRAEQASPEEMLALHGRVELSNRDPEPGHPVAGEPKVTVDGTTFHKGGKVVLRPDPDRDVYDSMLAGRTATIERIYLDYDGTAHIGVTVDDDPAQELFRETGRYLFFKAGEVEAV